MLFLRPGSRKGCGQSVSREEGTKPVDGTNFENGMLDFAPNAVRRLVRPRDRMQVALIRSLQVSEKLSASESLISESRGGGESRADPPSAPA